MWFVPLEVDLQFVNPSYSCWSLLCQNTEMQPWFPFFWVRSWQRVTFSVLGAAGVTGSQRIRLSVSYGKSLVCCGCCFDFLVMCIFIHVCKTNTVYPTATQIPCNPSSTTSSQCYTQAQEWLIFYNCGLLRTLQRLQWNGLIQKYFLHHHQWLIFLGLHFLCFSNSLGVLYLASYWRTCG